MDQEDRHVGKSTRRAIPTDASQRGVAGRCKDGSVPNPLENRDRDVGKEDRQQVLFIEKLTAAGRIIQWHWDHEPGTSMELRSRWSRVSDNDHDLIVATKMRKEDPLSLFLWQKRVHTNRRRSQAGEWTASATPPFPARLLAYYVIVDAEPASRQE
ncbi:unnamed protein product [Caenorhabditis auriculariae]|uniref:Uncharacterized protein n=1 Tax=Caenorhabditis auriculariae TaxID=2777116 RepID=A0A8S1HU52_9PELO|nr:unnamed protein product [Caenorhabditis auriculariae]